MHIRVLSVQLKPDSAAETTRFFRDSVGPALKEQPGFNSSRVMIDQDSGKCLMVTQWESEADLHASETSGFLEKQLGHLGQFFATRPTIDIYEVVLQVTPES